MIPRQVAIEYRVDKAGPSVEREQLNRVLEDIKKQIANLGGDVNYVTQQQLTAAIDAIAFPPSGGGVVEVIVAGFAISVDNTDPANPIVSVVPADLISADAGNQLVLGADSLLYVPDTGTVPTTRTLTAGVGLTGGGDLSADRTFNLANTAVTPGTYADDGRFYSITVDAQGRITDIFVSGLIAIDAAQVVSGTFGTSQIANDAITNAKLRDSAALSVLGRSANSTGDPADIAAAFDHQVLRRSGTSVGFGQIDLAQPAAVTGALGVPNGGMGTTTLTSGSYMQGNGTSAVTMRTPAQVWADIDNTALATVQTWTAAQTWTGISYQNGGMRVKTTDRTGGGTMTTSDYYVLVSGVAGITLPAAPNDGQTLVLKETAGFNCTVNRNGNNIDLVAANYTLPLDGSVRFVFRTGNGWFTFAA